MQYLKDMALPLIALGTAQDSLTTLFSQKPEASNLQDNGFNPGRDIKAATEKEGVKALFQQKIPMLIKSFSGHRRQTYTPGYRWSPAFRQLAFFLNYLQDHGIETKIFINPYHIQYLAVIDHAGLSGEFFLWKRQLVQTISEISRDGTLTLWDFSEPGAYTTEPFLKAGKTPLHWFWEPAHYRKELGDLMITRLLGATDTRFGHILIPQNIDNRIRAYQDRFRTWQTTQPEEAAVTGQSE